MILSYLHGSWSWWRGGALILLPPPPPSMPTSEINMLFHFGASFQVNRVFFSHSLTKDNTKRPNYHDLQVIFCTIMITYACSSPLCICAQNIMLTIAHARMCACVVKSLIKDTQLFLFQSGHYQSHCGYCTNKHVVYLVRIFVIIITCFL